jgi:hypothetical protein
MEADQTSSMGDTSRSFSQAFSRFASKGMPGPERHDSQDAPAAEGQSGCEGPRHEDRVRRQLIPIIQNK